MQFIRICILNEKLKVAFNRDSSLRVNAKAFEVRSENTAPPGLSEATVHVITTLGSVNLEYFLWRVVGNVKGNDYGTAPNGLGLHERQCVDTL
ncbi:hypothetical protein FQA39_LY10624 [Lamprigera yunnana]|nr:hypothetical protein FQA39_LY10624 [Lamprigera yunnana]